MYELYKVHKGTTDNDKVPQFPSILSAVVTCNYNLAKFSVSSLKQFTINEYTVKDHFPFGKEIIYEDPNLFIASFDIESLLRIILWMRYGCVDMVFEKRRKIKGIPKRHFKQFPILSVKSSSFLFNGVYYKQIDSVAMDSPLALALIITKLFLVYYEYTNISKYIFGIS